MFTRSVSSSGAAASARCFRSTQAHERISVIAAAATATGVRVKDLGAIGDGSRVAETATVLRVSELDLFRLAHEKWFGRVVDERELEIVFKRFLERSETPMWVRDFTRKIGALRRAGLLDPSRFGAKAETPGRPVLRWIGGAAFAGMLTVLFLLVYFADRAQSLENLVCILPPCY
jgi:hypothetical protein